MPDTSPLPASFGALCCESRGAAGLAVAGSWGGGASPRRGGRGGAGQGCGRRRSRACVARDGRADRVARRARIRGRCRIRHRAARAGHPRRSGRARPEPARRLAAVGERRGDPRARRGGRGAHLGREPVPGARGVAQRRARHRAEVGAVAGGARRDRAHRARRAGADDRVGRRRRFRPGPAQRPAHGARTRGARTVCDRARCQVGRATAERQREHDRRPHPPHPHGVRAARTPRQHEGRAVPAWARGRLPAAAHVVTAAAADGAAAPELRALRLLAALIAVTTLVATVGAGFATGIPNAATAPVGYRVAMVAAIAVPLVAGAVAPWARMRMLRLLNAGTVLTFAALLVGVLVVELPSSDVLVQVPWFLTVTAAPVTAALVAWGRMGGWVALAVLTVLVQAIRLVSDSDAEDAIANDTFAF